jgi:hypothetical protein
MKNSPVMSHSTQRFIPVALGNHGLLGDEDLLCRDLNAHVSSAIKRTSFSRKMILKPKASFEPRSEMKVAKNKNPKLGFRLLNTNLRVWFSFGISKHLVKPRDFWIANFFPKIFKIHRLVWIFNCFECVSSMFRLKNYILILNFTNAVFSKSTFRSIFVS